MPPRERTPASFSAARKGITRDDKAAWVFTRPESTAGRGWENVKLELEGNRGVGESRAEQFKNDTAGSSTLLNARDAKQAKR